MNSAEIIRALAETAEGAEVTCTGHSMEPTLRAGDRVRAWAATRIQAGDVVLIEQPGETPPVMHRVVVRIAGTPWFVHCGDAGRRGGPGVARLRAVIARVDLPRRRPPLGSYLSSARAVLATVRRRLLAGRSAGPRG